jgi:hypothetical protein
MSAPPPGIEGILAVLDPQAAQAPGQAESRGMGGGATEMLRNEALLLCPALLAGNADLQKIVAFSGAFEKLFQIVNQEGGTDGGIVVQDALTALGGLLRFNVSNQVCHHLLFLADSRTISENYHLSPLSLPSWAFPPISVPTHYHQTTSHYNTGLNKRSTTLV